MQNEKLTTVLTRCTNEGIRVRVHYSEGADYVGPADLVPLKSEIVSVCTSLSNCGLYIS